MRNSNIETNLMFLLLAAGVSCAPPLELDPVTTVTTTAAPRLETTETSLPYIESTTSVVDLFETTTQEKLGPKTTESKKLQETTTAINSLNQITTMEQIEEMVQAVTTEIPATELSASTAATPTTTMATQALVELSTTSRPAFTTPQTRSPYISGNERETLLSYLGNVDLNEVDKLILTPRQQQAITQELEHQKLGLTPFSDPSPWQRLTKDQQMEFNRKYLALRQDLQEYSRNKFLSLSEEMQEHAYNAFISLDINTLAEVITNEVKREQEEEIQRMIEERERLEKEQQQQRHRDFKQQQRNRFQEQPRSQHGIRLNSLNFNKVEQKSEKIQTSRQRQNFDPRMRKQQQFQQNRFQQPQPQIEQQLSSFEHLQCLANPSLCRS